MATESVNFVISAEDKASAKFRQTQKELDQTAKSVREVGGKAKASAELVGSLANSLGGSWLGAASGQIAQLTERMSAFSEVGKSSTSAMLLFKATIVGTAAVAVYQFTSAILEQASGFKRLQEEIDIANESLLRFSQLTLSRENRKFQQEMTRISLLESEEEQDKRLRAMQMHIGEAVFRAAQTARMERERLADMRGDTGFWGYQSSEHEQAIKQQEIAVQLAERERDQLQSQVETIKEKLTYEKEIARIQADLAAAKEQEKVKEDQRLAAEKAANDERVAKEREVLKLQQDQARERQKIADSTMRSVDQLKLQLVELRDGEKAASVLRYTMQGIDEATANQLASMEALVSAINNGTNTGSAPTGGPSGPLAAMESRFLSGRTVQTDYTKLSAESNKQTAEHTKLQLAKMDSALAQLELIASYTSNQIEEAR